MRKRILVVEDDQMLRSIIQELLEDELYEVDTAIDGVDALGQLSYQRNVYDVILLDLTMPRLNGMQFLYKIQQRDSSLLRSIIAFSADEDTLQQAACMGIYNILEKPFDLDVLLALIVRAIRSSQEARFTVPWRRVTGVPEASLKDGSVWSEE